MRPCLIKALSQQIFTTEAKKFVGEYNNYGEYWERSFSDRFFDMGTMIRLGTSIEIGLKSYYMKKKLYSSLTELKSDPHCSQNIFQRIQPWNTSGGAINLFYQQIGCDLNTNSFLLSVQEIMLHRHLYAHNSGLIDDKYIERYKTLTGIDISSDEKLIDYPSQDIYWFEPLKKLNEFIDYTREFFKLLA
ncbi:MAG: hypothetical protein G8237_14905 [Magnetococcales bacterium]|nr:hypothetical protein [Magnetococcales bacterium]